MGVHIKSESPGSFGFAYKGSPLLSLLKEHGQVTGRSQGVHLTKNQDTYTPQCK